METMSEDKGTVQKHCVMVDKAVFYEDADEHLKALFMYTGTEQISKCMVFLTLKWEFIDMQGKRLD